MHNIKYFLVAGTLLGAIRHKGFIPWDDDLDIGLLRSEYEKFMAAAKTDLDPRFFLQTWDSDTEYGLPFAKLQARGTRYVEANARSVECEKGIYVDIFPFDNTPNHMLARQMHAIKTYVLKRLILAKLNYEVWGNDHGYKKLVYRVVKIGLRLASADKLKKRLEKEMTRYNHTETHKVAAIGGAYGYRKESIERQWLDNLRFADFEGHRLPIFAAFARYLTYFYGDYMTPPPDDKKCNRHNIVDVDLGGFSE